MIYNDISQSYQYSHCYNVSDMMCKGEQYVRS